MNRQGSILVSLLWIVAILSLVVVGVLHSANLDLRVTKNSGDSIQAYYLALAGIEQAKAVIYQDAKKRREKGINHTGDLYDSPTLFQDVEFARGRFRIGHGGDAGTEEDFRYGIIDEERFLNFNTAGNSQIGRLQGMDENLAGAIKDYRDNDQEVSPGGGEFNDYAAMKPPYIPHDAPFRTLRELLLVRGMPRDLLLGEDVNANGWLDPEENDGELFPPQDNQDGVLDRGWLKHATVWSAVRNTDARGETRVNIKEADEAALAEVEGITTDLAKSIVQYRNSQQLDSLADLLEVKAIRQNSSSSSSSSRSRSGNSSSGTPTGSNLIDRDLFRTIADALTASEDAIIPGAINVNTASAEVLSTLPGFGPELVGAIIAHRSSSGFFNSVGDLFDVDGMTDSILKQVVDRITTRSETFRITSEGRVASTGARRRLQVVVRVGDMSVETLAYREDL